MFFFACLNPGLCYDEFLINTRVSPLAPYSLRNPEYHSCPVPERRDCGLSDRHLSIVLFDMMHKRDPESGRRDQRCRL